MGFSENSRTLNLLDSHGLSSVFSLIWLQLGVYPFSRHTQVICTGKCMKKRKYVVYWHEYRYIYIYDYYIYMYIYIYVYIYVNKYVYIYILDLHLGILAVPATLPSKHSWRPSHPRSQEHGDASGHLAWWIAASEGDGDQSIGPYGLLSPLRDMIFPLHPL